jgi:prepilin-type N-terminal cleavage/methylation domain-containing protein
MNTNRREPLAFTLIELLVVLTIVALLVALLMPALSAARTVAQLSQSLSNIRQVQFSVLNYAQDNKQSFPLSRYGYVSSSETYLPTWPGWLYERRYITSPEVLWGPARDRSDLDLAAMKASIYHPDWYYPGYGLNSAMVAVAHETTWVTAKHPLKLNQNNVPPHSRFVMLLDVWHNVSSWSKGIAGHYEGYPLHINGNPNAGPMLFNYNGAIPHGFLDGHAKATDGSNLGWDVAMPSPVGAGVETRPGPYAGNWSYPASGWPICPGEPWYQDWWMH